MGPLALIQAVADGCFVFKWNKAIDINEPTQKAIIVHDAGREDLLLQVKYEGPLEEFGWLIPVPSLPKVEKGSMEAFYELSQLTQRQFAWASRGVYMGGNSRHEAVKVVEVKTVGAYEVAVLSAQDSGSLALWLQAHDYSLPEGKTEIVDDYIRRGWYFIAAKIELNKGLGFKTVSSTAPKDTDASAKAHKIVESQLSSGELHPLLISFDTPKCVFPLKISAVGGKPSELSLYVLSAEPLLERFMFDEALEKLRQQREKWVQEWEQNRAQRQKANETTLQNSRSLQLAAQMYSLMPRGASGRPLPDWSLDDLVALGKEGQPAVKWEALDLDDNSYASSYELLRISQLKSGQIPQCIKATPRLKGKDWFLTKHVRTFWPEEMHDLEFESAIPNVAQTLPRLEGAVSAQLLSHCGQGAVPMLIAACGSTNATERINASAAAGLLKDPRYIVPLLGLLKDEVPKVRLNAISGAERNWDPRFVEPLVSLLRDENIRIRSHATQCLRQNDPGDRPQMYLDLLKDADPDVQSCALQILSRTNATAIPRAELVRLLGAERIQTVAIALSLLGGQEMSPFNQPGAPSAFATLAAEKTGLASADAAPLTTNRITLARLTGLKILDRNADAKAVELILPLLSDTNSIVRNRAFGVLQTITGRHISENDPAKWEAWWAVSKTSFTPHRPAQ